MKILSTVLLALILGTIAQAEQRWTKTYGGTGTDEAYSVQQTSDGGYIVAGATNSFGIGGYDYDVYLIKTNASGDTLWTRRYGGTGVDFGYSVQQTSDGGCIVVGSTTSFGNGSQVYLIKSNASGDTQWTRTYGGPKGDDAHAVRQTSDGGYIIAGQTSSYGDTAYDNVYLIKTDASGGVLWAQNYGGAMWDWVQSVQQTSDGGYILTGATYIVGTGYNVWLIKTNVSGDTLWTRRYGGGEDYGYSVQQTTDGGYIVGGFTYAFGAGQEDAYLIKTNASGDTLWTRTYGGPVEDRAYSVQQTMDGGYVLGGYTNSFYTPGGADSFNVWLIKTNASGDTEWTRTMGGFRNDYGYSVQQTSDGGYVIAGSTNSFADTLADVYLIKLDGDGSLGTEEPGSTKQQARVSIEATPNPFVSFARIPGHEAERFHLFDISGKIVGTYRGDRIGEGLSPAVDFIRLDDGHGGSMRVVKVRQ